MAAKLSPFERFVEKQLKQAEDNLPDPRVDYWGRYLHLLAGLRENVYPYVNAGLSSLSKSSGIYTDHGPDHFDEVVRYAGLLLSIPGKSGYQGLQPYEYYLLLCAIRLHDAGNIDGREEHERHAAFLLEQYGGNIVYDSTEFQLISSIAQAHGGHRLDGNKDTISGLFNDNLPVGGTTCRPRHVAALVRFADEICEHRGRAAGHMLRNGTLPAQNQLFHIYASSIVGAFPDRSDKSFKLVITINAEYLTKKYPIPSKPGTEPVEKYLVDEIRERIQKLDRERIYCNQFLEPSLQTTRIEVAIRITRSIKIGSILQEGVIDEFNYKIPPAHGYPSNPLEWQDDKFFGDKIAAKVQEELKK